MRSIGGKGQKKRRKGKVEQLDDRAKERATFKKQKEVKVYQPGLTVVL